MFTFGSDPCWYLVLVRMYMKAKIRPWAMANRLVVGTARHVFICDSDKKTDSYPRRLVRNKTRASLIYVF